MIDIPHGSITKSQVDDAKHRIFTPEAVSGITDADCLGVMVSQYLEWDGFQILECAGSALEDANFHKEADQIRQLLYHLQQQARAEQNSIL